MSINEQTLKGFYTPGFFHVYLNTDEEISDFNDLKKTNKEVFSTFLHEYIHYLQNYTSISGMYLADLYLEHIKYQVNFIKSNELKVSLPIEVTSDFNRDSIIALEEIYGGEKSKTVNNCEYVSYFSRVETISPKIGSAINPIKFIVKYKNSNKIESYGFGYLALKEYVAHKLQNIYYRSTDAPVIPYTIVDLIIMKELPQLSNKENLKILLCDASLMCYHPAQFFFNSLERIKKDKCVLDYKPLAFYNFLFQGFNEGFDGVEYKGLSGAHSVFKKVKSNLINSYKAVFSSPSFVCELNLMLHVVEAGYLLRTKYPLFILNLVKDEDNDLNFYFKNIINKMGVPTIINNKNKGYLIPPRKFRHNGSDIIQGTLFIAASEISKNLSSRKKICNLNQFCENNYTDGHNPVDYQCYENPFMKLKDDPACAFVQLCKTWGIHEKEYVY